MIQNKQHSDVINQEPSCLILGFGWVGQSVRKYFTNSWVFDPLAGLVIPDESVGSRVAKVADTLQSAKDYVEKNRNGQLFDIAFICVPTPMDEETGQCITDYVEDAVKEWHTFCKVMVIRSTVEPGTTNRLNAIYKTNVVMQPEYLGETLGHPLADAPRDPFIILGGEKHATEWAARCWSRVVNANARIRQIDARAAEFCKYMENSFLATKVLFVNEWAQLARSAGVDFYELREAWLDDPRIGRSHTFAYESNIGFAGKCLPKDVNAIAYYARKVIKSPMRMLEAILRINADMRRESGMTGEAQLLPKKPIWQDNPEQ